MAALGVRPDQRGTAGTGEHLNRDVLLLLHFTTTLELHLEEEESIELTFFNSSYS